MKLIESYFLSHRAVQSSNTRQEALGIQKPSASLPTYQQICQKLEKVSKPCTSKVHLGAFKLKTYLTLDFSCPLGSTLKSPWIVVKTFY